MNKLMGTDRNGTRSNNNFNLFATLWEIYINSHVRVAFVYEIFNKNTFVYLDLLILS